MSDITKADIDGLVEKLGETNQALVDFSAKLEDFDPEPAPAPDPGEGGSGLTEEQIEALIDAKLAELDVDTGGSLPDDVLTYDEAEALFEELIAGIDFGDGEGAGFPAELRDEFESVAAEFRFPARLLNDQDPQDSEGRYHGVDHWGLVFDVKRPCYIRSAVVDAEETGTFTAVLNRYTDEDSEEFEVVDRVEVDVDEAGEPVEVSLGLEVPEEGRYQLTRDGEFGLWRGEYNGWDEHFVDGLRVVTGGKPDALRDGGYSDEDFWYYYYSVEFTASPDHEFEG